MNALSLAVNVGAGLLLVPYLVRHLGTAAYGLVPLTMVLSEYVGIITQSFNSVVQRYLAIEINKKDFSAANAVFNTSFFIVLAFIVGQGGIVAALVGNVDDIINIPSGLVRDTIWLVTLTTGGYLFSLLSAVFSVSMYSQNRVDLLRQNDIIRIGIRLVLIFGLFAWKGPGLIPVGVANLVAGLVDLTMSLYYWRQLTPFLRIAPRKIELGRFRPMAAMAGWLLVSQVGYLLFLRIDIYVINRFIGPAASGEYAAVLQWNQLFRTAAGVLSGAIAPLGLIYYARGEIDKLIEMMCLAVKTMSLFLAVPLALVSAFSGDILALWLGEQFRPLGTLLLVHMLGLVLNLSVLPLFAIMTALNRVKIPALVTILLGGINLLLAIALIRGTTLGYYGVALAGAAVLTIKNALFTTFYVSRILKIKARVFTGKIAAGLAVFTFIFLLCRVQARYLPAGDNGTVVIVLLLVNAILTMPFLTLLYSHREKSLIVSAAPLRFRPFLSGMFLKKPS
jgi:membrane protein EpsK